VITSGEPGPTERLGPYRLEERLGEGEMGPVFRAVREPDGLQVALRVLRPELSHDDVFRRRFVHEARAAAEVQHRNLVRILEAGEADGRSFLAVELVHGQTLERRLEAEVRLPVDEVVRLVAHVGSGLDALHAAGLVHRDVRPSNIMLEEDGSALLVDFGLARGPAFTGLTHPGVGTGTLDYLAPELLRGDEATAASDLYALGGVAYQCLTGRTPFAHRSLLELAGAHLSEAPPEPAAVRPETPPGLSWAIRQALSKDPGQRPPTGPAFADLVAFGAGRGRASPA